MIEADEIHELLRLHNCRGIATRYGPDGAVTALAFTLATPFGERSYRLPANTDGVYRALPAAKSAGKLPGLPWHRIARDQAARVSWRILKDWVEAQMALIDTGMVQMQEVFLPYMLADKEGRTVYEIMEGGRFLLAEPQ